MGSFNRLIMLKKTHFEFLSSNSFWVFLSKFIAFVFGSIFAYFFRVNVNSNFDELMERESSDCVDNGGDDSAVVSSSSKYEFLYKNGISGFIEEPKAESFTLHELYMDSKPSDSIDNFTEESALSFSFPKFKQERWVEEAKVVTVEEKKTEDSVSDKAEHSVLSSMVEECFDQPGLDIEEQEDVGEGKPEDSVESFIVERWLEKPIEEKHNDGLEGNDHVEEKYGDFFESPGIDLYLDKWKKEKEEECNEDGEMISPRSKADNKDSKTDSIAYEVLANNGQQAEELDHEIHEPNTCVSDQKAAILTGLINDSDDEFIELDIMGETMYREESQFSPERSEEATFHEEEEEEEEEDDDDDSEDDELLERLKMELRMARTGGLPTILEESESPKMVQELRPLQIDDKFDHKHHMAEIQKVYKSYSDKMRKLDILNSQTMHAISLLQLKDPVRLSMAGKSSAPAVKSLLSQNVWPFKQRKPEADHAMKLIRDLQSDFETVYVGQVCLSWEILHWQYGKVKELLECDKQGIRQYNQVAEELQLFQVLVQRFLENEPFQDKPRVENYVKNRCRLRHLLQVPVIKDDGSKYKKAVGEEDAVPSEILTYIIEESLHVFWEFLRADKDEANSTSKTPHQGQVAPHDPIDLELLMDVRADLQKKEKRLKEIQRSTNCIIKKFQRQHQGNLLDHALFIAQIELKLVSRVVNMLKISTDQLVWCHEKLQKINFSSRKVEIEPSFTLFPC